MSAVTELLRIPAYALNMPQTASPEILERFKEGFECWNGGELDLMQDMYAADGEYDVSAVFTDTPPYRGHESMRRQWDEMWEIWEGVRMDPLEVFDVGGGRFVVDVRLWGKGKRSGAEVVFLRNRPVSLPGEPDLDEELLRIHDEAVAESARRETAATGGR